jgi:hypothetical protein
MPIKYYPVMKKLRDWAVRHGHSRLANKAHYAYLENKMVVDHVTLACFLGMMRSMEGVQEVYAHGAYIFTVQFGKVIVTPQGSTYKVTFKGWSPDYLTKEERKALDE